MLLMVKTKTSKVFETFEVWLPASILNERVTDAPEWKRKTCTPFLFRNRLFRFHIALEAFPVGKLISGREKSVSACGKSIGMLGKWNGTRGKSISQYGCSFSIRGKPKGNNG